MTRTLEILDRLIAFPTVSSAPNLPMADWIATFLGDLGFVCHRLPDPTGTKAGLLARIGSGEGGALLSAHMDVVPVEGQAWTRDPFRLTREGGRLFGRGTTDMKGFLAAALAAAEAAARCADNLARPLMLSLSYDEEVGCRGMAAMIGALVPKLGRPDLAIVGEPTSLDIATGHKGKVAARALFRGEPGHSALAPRFANALHGAADFIVALRAEQDRIAATGARDEGYDIPYTTLHAGRMQGGIALNIVPDRAEVEFEIRHLAADDPDAILPRLGGTATAIEVTSRYPGLDADPAGPAVRAVRALAPEARLTKVAYGTEAGFLAAAGIPTVVCGPGSMAQGHQPDEFIEAAELDRADAMLARLVGSLRA
jgi:acetylornithine deacetylase